MNHFAKLVGQIGSEYDRRQYDRNAARLGRRIREGGQRNHRDVAGLGKQLATMAKALTVDLTEARAAQRQNAIDTLAAINDRATEMARTGQISGEQGALLDGAIARAADRIRGL